MAIHTLIDCNGFRSGNNYGVEDNGGAGGFAVNTAAGFSITNEFPLSKQGADPYIGKIVNGVADLYSKSKRVTSPTDWCIFELYVYFEQLPIGSSNDKAFFACGGTDDSSSEWHWSIRYDKDGNLSLYDANQSLIATATGVIAAQNWYRVVAMFKWSDSSIFKLWWGVQGPNNHTLTFDEAAMDTKNAATNDVGMVFVNQSSGLESNESCYVNYVFMTSDQTNWNDNDLTGTISNPLFMGNPDNDVTCGDWTVLGPYRSGIANATPDAGDNLATGNWDDAEEIPGTDGSFIKYVISTTGPDLSGVIYSDDGSIGGPSGDSDVDNQIVGAVWIGRGKRDINGARKPTWRFIYGKWDGSSLTTTDSGSKTDGSFTNYSFVEGGASDVRVPADDEFIAMGLYGDHQLAGVGGAAYIADMYGCILHAETPPAAASIAVFRRRIEGY